MEKIYKNREAALKAANDFLNEHPGWQLFDGGGAGVLYDDYGHELGYYPYIAVGDGIEYPPFGTEWEQFYYEP